MSFVERFVHRNIPLSEYNFVSYSAMIIANTSYDRNLTLLLQKAHMGLLTGYEVLPDDNTVTAGFWTVRVAP